MPPACEGACVLAAAANMRNWIATGASLPLLCTFLGVSRAQQGHLGHWPPGVPVGRGSPVGPLCRCSSGHAEQIGLQCLWQDVSDRSRIVPQNTPCSLVSATSWVLRVQLLYVLRDGKMCTELRIKRSGGLITARNKILAAAVAAKRGSLPSTDCTVLCKAVSETRRSQHDGKRRNQDDCLL